MTGMWIFGYGSLVSPVSFGHTLGRTMSPGVDFHEAELAGYGRRWNYGVMTRSAESVDERGEIREWTIVALGLVEAVRESVNGVIGWVADDEVAALDRRERHYDRVDVSDLVATGDAAIDAPVMTYVPRPEPIAHYRAARDRGTAAVEQRYWDLVDAAFGELGAGSRRRYHASTPAPDVPVVSMRIEHIPERHRFADNR